VGWPDTGPVVTFRGTGVANGYAFIARQHLSGLAVVNTPSYSLYHVISQSAGPIPSVSLLVSSFWSSTQIGYGSAASVVNNGFVRTFTDGKRQLLIPTVSRCTCTAPRPTASWL
jgi:hypothetical protein